MTTIEKLAISGIRAFNPNEREAIQFFTPLTLIVGTNGAGKTTIIESLKYATTGEIPQGVEKSQWVHDPRISNEVLVKGQVILRFKNSKGKIFAAVRNVELANRNKSLKFTTKSSELSTQDVNGDITQVTYRCTDLNKMIPGIMGVSKAILKDVIFCHQEESNWPLAKSAELKKKFEEIFASTRYTKALKMLNDHLKETRKNLKQLELQLETLEAHRNTAHTLLQEKEQHEADLSRSREIIEQLDIKITQKSEEVEAVKDSYNEMKDNIEQMNANKRFIKELENRLQRDKNAIDKEELIGGTNEELRMMLDNFTNELENLANEGVGIENQLQDLEIQKSQFETESHRLSEEHARIISNQRQVDNITSMRNQAIEEFSAKYGLNYDSSIAEDQIERFLIDTDALGEKSTAKLKKKQIDYRDKDAALSDAYEAARVDFNNAQNKIMGLTDEINAKQEKMKAIGSEIQEKEQLHQQLHDIQNTLTSEKETLDKMKSQFNEDEYKVLLQDNEKAREEIEIKINVARKDINSLSLHANERAKLEGLLQRKQEEQDLYQTKLSSCEDDILEIFGIIPDPESLETEILGQKNSIIETMNEVQKELQLLQEKDANSSGKISSLEERLLEINSEKSECDESLSILNGADLPDTIRKIEKSIRKCQTSIARLKSIQILYTQFYEKALETPCCPLCYQDLPDVDQFLQERKDLLDKVPGQIEAKQAKLNALLEEKRTFSKLSVTWERAKSLENNIPRISESLGNLKSEKAKYSDDINDLTARNNTLKKELEKAEKLVTASREIKLHFLKFKSFVKKVDEQKAILHSLSNDDRTIEEVSKYMKDLQEQSTALKKEYESLSSEQRRTSDTINQKLALCNKLEKDILEIRGSNEMIFQLKNQYEEMESFVQQKIPEIESLKEEYNKRKADADKISQRREAEQLRWEKSSETYEEAKQTFVSEKNNIHNIIKQLQGTKQVGNAQSIIEEKKAMDQKLDEINTNLKLLRNKQRKIDSLLSNREKTKINLQRNIDLRDLQNEINLKRMEVEEMKHAISERTGGITPESIDIIQKELAKWEKKKSKISGKVSVFRGEIKNRSRALASAKYRNIDDEYRSHLIKVKTTDIVTKDMKKYHKALEQALMKYHSIKMIEINKVIKELWETTYRGRDIDTVEIRAEPDKTGRNRSYNYRVVMLKEGVRIDMRGCCSAGQKVIASLIIRMALAEVFCTNCGIMALDEPTTNLDRDNVESFANALVRIIDQRKAQSGFQLVIITHDESFVSMLGRSEHADKYYRVTKDTNGYSRIRQRNIIEL
eukprot:TRINITY_DN7502_c0_g1_i1.p1 TRINITY_DN7502_c0_g1~~TRINITY_DN7502_c0_g1_i1.p1  ORF type:complete len:1298 (-),score=335.25 TRINITY_DN7502_c0_g1_i1:96-3989(-)